MKQWFIGLSRKIIFFFLLVFSSVGYAAMIESPILDYRPIFVPGYDAQGNLAIAICMYYVDKAPYFLIVNPATLQTSVLPTASFKSRSSNPQAAPGYYTMAALEKTPYLIALSKYSAPPLYCAKLWVDAC